MRLVLTLRLRPTMVRFGAESWIPTMVGMTIIQEMGPIITGLMVAGKVGSNIGAELSSMRVTEQIDAMAVSGIAARLCPACAAVAAADGSPGRMPAMFIEWS